MEKQEKQEKSPREIATEIVKKISDTAIELAFTRHDLTSDEFDETNYPNVGGMRHREQAFEQFVQEIKEDTLNCLTGDDFGCLDPEELDATNCELIWLTAAIEKALRDRDERVWRDAAQRLRDKADEWRQQADRWQRNAQSAGMDIIREQDYVDRDVCLSKMSAAMTLAIEFDDIASAIRGKS